MHIDAKERLYATIATILVAVFFITATISGMAMGFAVPKPNSLVDPLVVKTPGAIQGTLFGETGEAAIREISPGNKEVYIIAQMWSFLPNKMTFKVGDHVTFHVTSADVQHGFMIQHTNVNMMILPGQISTLSHTFKTAGTYNLICHEFCGTGHHTMYGVITVEP